MDADETVVVSHAGMAQWHTRCLAFTDHIPFTLTLSLTDRSPRHRLRHHNYASRGESTTAGTVQDAAVKTVVSLVNSLAGCDIR